jgi:hypothetical protein
MRKLATVLAFLLVSPCIWAGSETLKFDDISTSSYAPIASSYDGFSFGSGWFVANNSWYNTTYINDVTYPSTPNVAFNGYGSGTISMSSATPMKLTSLYAAWFAEYNEQASFSSTSLTIDAFMGVTEVGTDTILLGTNFALSDVNLPLANNWTFTNSGSTAWWLADNVTFTTATSATPEPSSLILFGTSLLGLVPFRRKLFVR